MENINQIISSNVKGMRQLKKLSQARCAEYLGFSQPAYSKYESGNITWDVITLVKIAKLFECPLLVLLNGVEMGWKV